METLNNKEKAPEKIIFTGRNLEVYKNILKGYFYDNETRGYVKDIDKANEFIKGVIEGNFIVYDTDDSSEENIIFPKLLTDSDEECNDFGEKIEIKQDSDESSPKRISEESDNTTDSMTGLELNVNLEYLEKYISENVKNDNVLEYSNKKKRKYTVSRKNKRNGSKSSATRESTNERIKITEEQLDYLVDFADLIIKKEISISEVLNIMSQLGMKKNSVKCYITAYRRMYEGKSFDATVNTKILDRFLAKIKEEYGSEVFDKAIMSVESYLDRRPNAKARLVLLSHWLSE